MSGPQWATGELRIIEVESVCCDCKGLHRSRCEFVIGSLFFFDPANEDEVTICNDPCRVCNEPMPGYQGSENDSSE